MRRVENPHGRAGATLVEGAVVLSVFLTLVLGLLDLGVCLLRYHLVAAAARQGARQAVVRGSLATGLGSWGPAAVGPVRAADPSPLAAAVRPFLVGIDPASATVRATWPDGGNEPDQRVCVTVTVPYRPLLTSLLGAGTVTLQATSTMPIAH